MSHFSFPAGNAPGIEFRVASGRLDLVESNNGTVTVDITGRGADNIIVEQIGDTVSIREERSRFTDRSVSVRVAVPPHTATDITAASLDVYARVELGMVKARTASGQLDFGKIAAGELRSASGDINLDTCVGRCQISTASGDVRGRTIQGDLAVSTASGDVLVDTVMGRLDARSASGDIDVACCHGLSVSMVAMSGDVSLGLPEGRRVEAQIDSLSGDVTLPSRKAPSGEAKETVRLRAKTVSGDVRLQRVDR